MITKSLWVKCFSKDTVIIWINAVKTGILPAVTQFENQLNQIKNIVDTHACACPPHTPPPPANRFLETQIDPTTVMHIMRRFCLGLTEFFSLVWSNQAEIWFKAAEVWPNHQSSWTPIGQPPSNLAAFTVSRTCNSPVWQYRNQIRKAIVQKEQRWYTNLHE